MLDRKLIDRANEVLERLFALDEAVANARTFRAFLDNLHARDLSIVKEPHVAAIAVVRAGILRSAVGTIMACLDPEDRRGNRASVGQILDTLRDATLVDVFPEREARRKPAAAALQQVREEYAGLIKSDLFERGRRLRNDAVAHTLIPDSPMPRVLYEDIYGLGDIAERLVIGLYQACDRGTPRFPGHQVQMAEHAKIFWDTYFSGMRPR